MHVPKRTFTPFGLRRLQNPQQRPANGASSKEQPSEPARIVDVERQKYLTPNRWYRLAAEQGDAGGQYTLGLVYGTGRGVPQDDAEAVRWYRLAAEQGGANVQYNLGSMYADGRGVPQDYVSAHRWLNLAAATGNEDARKARERVAASMTREQIAEAQARARPPSSECDPRRTRHRVSACSTHSPGPPR